MTSGGRGALEALRIRIAVFPVGNIPETPLQKYLRLLKSCATVQLVELTPPMNGTAVEKSIFLRQFGRKGTVLLDFILERDLSDDMEDFEDIQLYRRIYGAIGIGLCSDKCSVEEKTHDELTTKIAKLKYCQTTRCFLFEPPEGLADNNKNVIVIPNQDEGQVSFYLTTIVNDFTVSLLRHFETLAAELSSLPVIVSPRDADSKLPREQQHRLKLRTNGRLSKLLGDLYLLAGAYSDAVNSFVAAVEETKTNGDLLWMAAAQEAMQIAMVLQNEQVLEDQSDSIMLLWYALPDKLREIAANYTKAGLPIMVFELNRCIANLLAALGNLSEAAMTLSASWSIHPSLSFSDKVYMATWIIETFHELKMPRKRAFFLQAFSSMLSSNQEHGIALSILIQAFDTYNIQIDTFRSGGWLALRSAILRRAAELAENHKDHLLHVKYVCALLAYSRTILSTADQIQFAKTLRQRARHDALLLSLSSEPWPCLLSIFKGLSLHRELGELWQARQDPQENLPLESDTFIYNPFSKETSSQIDLFTKLAIAVNDLVKFDFILCNPFAFPIELQKLRLVSEGDGVPILSEEITATIPANCPSKTITMHCTPLEAGILRIGKLETILFGLKMDISIPSSFLTSEVVVMGEQPLLKLKKSSILRDALSLYDGQVATLQLELENVGHMPAAYVNVTWKDLWNETVKGVETIDAILFPPSPSPLCLKNWDEMVKLEPASQRTLQIDIIAQMGWLGSTISIEYSQETKRDSYRKVLQYSFMCTVHPSVLIKNVCVLPFQSLRFPFDWEGEGVKKMVQEHDRVEGARMEGEQVIDQSDDQTRMHTKKAPIITPIRQSSSSKSTKKHKHRSSSKTKDTSHIDQRPSSISKESSISRLHQEAILSSTYLPGPAVKASQEEDFNEEMWCLIAFDAINNTDDRFFLQIITGDVQIGWTRLSRLSSQRLVFPIRRMQITREQLQQPIYLSDTQTISLRRLSGSEDEMAGIDALLYWIKSKLFESLKISWEIDQMRRGIVNIDLCDLGHGAVCCLRESNLKIGVQIECGGRLVSWRESASFLICAIDQPVAITISIECLDGAMATDGDAVMIRVLPAVHLSDDEYGIEYDDILCIDGFLQAVHPLSSGQTALHKVILWPLSHCRIRLLLQAERISDRSTHWLSKPIMFEFVKMASS